MGYFYLLKSKKISKNHKKINGYKQVSNKIITSSSITSTTSLFHILISYTSANERDNTQLNPKKNLRQPTKLLEKKTYLLYKITLKKLLISFVIHNSTFQRFHPID